MRQLKRMNFCFRRPVGRDFGLRYVTHALLLGFIVILAACTGPKTVGSADPTAPTISAQPESQSVSVGATATFSVMATGTPPLTYQWSKDGAAVSGATDSSYTTPATVTGDDGATFTVEVTNGTGNVASSAATLSVTSTIAAPSITVQPANQSVIAGGTATFLVTASGTSPLSYQWSKNGTSISGATASSYTTPATVIGDNGATFTVEVSNGAGNAVSAAATLTVTSSAVAPSVTTQPADQTVAVGAKAVFTVQASGTAPLTYQWSKNGAAISGATASSYTTPATVIGDNGTAFSVQVTNSAGNMASNSATLTVNNVAPTITAQPKNQTVNLGATATFAVTATGTSPITFQWLKNGTAIGAATASSYTTPATVAVDSGATFTVQVTNGAGTVQSSAATLTVNVTAPSITAQPKDQSVLVGATAAFSVTAAGTAPLTYQWSKKGTVISGATAASYTTPATVIGDNAATFSVKITNSGGSATSSAATLTVTASAVAPSIIAQPASQSVTVGTTANFSVTAGGTAPLTYQWSKNGAAISGATGAGYTTPATVLVDSGASFAVTVTNSAGNATSAAAILTVNGIGPTITAQPLNQSVVLTGTATFSVSATGTPTPTYQWWKNSAAINGATGATYTTPATVITDNGATFRVVLTNSASIVTSNAATLTVTASGTVSVTPQLAPLTTSQTQQFTARVASTIITASWYVDGLMGGTPSVGTITTGGLYKPGAVGTHTVTATSGTQSGTATVAVTDLTGIYSFHSVGNDASRTGQNIQEYALTPAVLTSGNFGKIQSCAVDGAVYAQPLYVANLTIGDGSKHNVVFIATEHDSVYAFDADSPNCKQYWAIQFVEVGETPVPSGDTNCPDTPKEIGITGTPVINPSTQTLYFVAKTKNPNTSNPTKPLYFQRLYAVDLATGTKKFGSPVTIATPSLASGATNQFEPLLNHQRPGLAFTTNPDTVYIGWSSHCDQGTYSGWFMSFDATTLSPTALDVTPNTNGGSGGIWMSGGAPAVDSSNNVYLSTGNGDFNNNQTTGTLLAPLLSPTNLGMSFIKFSPGSLSPQDFYTPGGANGWSGGDLDISSSGVTVLPDGAGPPGHLNLLFGSDKQANLWLLDREKMGGFIGGTIVDNSVQYIQGQWANCLPKCTFSTAAYYNSTLYLGIGDMGVVAMRLSNGVILAASGKPLISSQTPDIFGFPGPTPTISASSSDDAIVWALDTSQYVSGPAVLRAYDATNLATRLYSSSAQPADTGPNAVKFTVPVVANGRVYVGGGGTMTVYGPLR
jgi:hypothetical protein